MPTRREFLEMTSAASLGALLPSSPASAAPASALPSLAPAGKPASAADSAAMLRRLAPAGRPVAITMWEFSWLERRWPGAGYEDWDVALDALAARGYDAVRIDPYPHLVSLDPRREWDILPCWNQQDWGAPALVRVQVQPALNQFIRACAAREIKVGLSTWFREDRANNRIALTTPERLGRAWAKTLDTIAADGLLEHLLYVDLCNEFPLDVWAPFFPARTARHSPEGVRWMRDAIAVVRAAHPGIPLTFSFTSEYDTWAQEDVSMHDFLELHCWMTHWTDFYEKVGYHYERFSSKGYENLVANGERLYREQPEHWRSALVKGIEQLAAWSRASGKPLVTTECWGIVDYKDWPLLDWGWVKELCELGVRTAAATGRWAGISTSNFCGPQFEGMWSDVEWHRRLTDAIHASALPR
jgi:hypothetical protein